MSLLKISKYMFPAIVGSDTRNSGVYDADTIYCSLSLGFNIDYRDQTFRLYGIDAYEVRKNSSKGIGEDHVKKGKIARDTVRELLPDGTEIILETVKSSKGKYGRYLAIVYVPISGREDIIGGLEGLKLLSLDSDTPTHFCLNDWLVREGHAVEKSY